MPVLLECLIPHLLKSRPDFWPKGQQYDTKGIKHAGPDQLKDLADELSQSNFSDKDIQGILGANFRRVAQQAWA